METYSKHLPFWSFFHELEKQLSYERWIDKYKIFLDQLYSTAYLDRGPEDSQKLLQLCKALYLQNISDEKRFETLFYEAWKKEKSFWETTFQNLIMHAQAEQAEAPPMPAAAKKEADKPAMNNNPGGNGATQKEPGKQDKGSLNNKENGTTKKYYYNPPNIPQPVLEEALPPAVTRTPAKHAFNLLDEYFLITRREMNKAWQYLRHEEKGEPTKEVNIPATVKKLARETIFTEPVFVTGKMNREDTLLIFVDCNGSMVPFHELSRRLINSAKAYGGHKYAEIFYFQNYPLGYVFERSNLTKPRKTIEAFARSNKQFTTAVIISDAGFARGFGNEKRFEIRLTYLEPFFKMLSGHCARTLWLNPMPENRWHKPTADAIQEKILKMAPVLEKGMNTFQNIMRNLLKVQPTLVNV
jgi:uncharacterized protein with von Willebrand factor type A (vWA) domain